MALIKCSECDCWVEDSSVKCPNCEHPVEKPISVESVGNNSASEQSGNDAGIYRQTVFPTTDTEYKHEKVIKGYATFLFWLIIVLTILSCIVTFIFAVNSGNIQFAFPFLAFGILIVIPLSVVVAYIIRAFFMVYSNISINLHEINMKLQK